MSLCIKCNKAEKVGYKYCTPCKKIIKRETELKSQRKRRGNVVKLCKECGKVEVVSKYCKDCRVIVKARENKERVAIWYEAQKEKRGLERKRKEAKKRANQKMIDPKWLVRGNISNSNRADLITAGEYL